jgi:RNA polymerase sigma-70 factor (family 1)
MAEQEDKVLIDDLYIGKECAFRKIYDRFYDRLYYSCFCIVQNTQEAEDIVIITLSKLFERHAGFRSLNQVHAWLFLTARNNCIDTLRRRKTLMERHREVENISDQTIVFQAINDELDVLLQDKILQLIQELPRQSRQVIILRYLEGMKYKEIGDQLNISPRTVENLLRYALERLRSLLTSKKLAVFLLLIHRLIP